MKGIIVDIKGKHAVALSEGGDFVKLANNGRLRVGYEVDISLRPGLKSSAFFRIAPAAAVFMLVIGLSVGAYAYSLPYAYINVDINPSVELTTNPFNMVINAEGLNTDGTKILSSLKYKNRHFEKVIGDVLEIAAEEGFIKDNSSNVVMFTVSGKDQEKAARIHDKIKNSVEKEIKKINVETEVVVEKVPLKKHDEARELGISPGKLALIEKLIEQVPEVKIDEWKDTPVKDIMKTIKNAKKAGKTPQKGKTKGSGAVDGKAADDKIADDETVDDESKDNENKDDKIIDEKTIEIDNKNMDGKNKEKNKADKATDYETAKDNAADGNEKKNAGRNSGNGVKTGN